MFYKRRLMPNTYSQIYIQIVFAVKGRECCIKESFREELQKYMSDRPCLVCKGARLKPWPLGVTVADRNISDLTNVGVGEAALFFAELRRQSEQLTGRESLETPRILSDSDGTQPEPEKLYPDADKPLNLNGLLCAYYVLFYATL